MEQEILLQVLKQAGPTALVAIIAIRALTKKANNNGVGEIKKAISNLQDNHLSDVKHLIEKVDEKLEKMDDKSDKIIQLLIRIEAKMNHNG